MTIPASQAYRDDLAKQRVKIFGYDPAASGVGIRPAKRESFDYSVCSKAGMANAKEAAPVLRTRGPWTFTSSDGMLWSLKNPGPGDSYGAWAGECQAAADANLASAMMFFGTDRAHESSEWLTLKISPEDLPPISPAYMACRCAPLSGEVLADLLSHVRESDAPGIAAMAAKNAKPLAQPILSIGSEQGTAAEFAAALQLVRAKNSAAERSTPRGLLIVRDAFDHRLGMWNEG